jgi:hypothetical protein
MWLGKTASLARSFNLHNFYPDIKELSLTHYQQKDDLEQLAAIEFYSDRLNKFRLSIEIDYFRLNLYSKVVLIKEEDLASLIQTYYKMTDDNTLPATHHQENISRSLVFKYSVTDMPDLVESGIDMDYIFEPVKYAATGRKQQEVHFIAQVQGNVSFREKVDDAYVFPLVDSC